MSPRLLLAVILLFPAAARAESFQAWVARASREEREKNDDAAIRSYSSGLSVWKDSDGKAAKAKAYCARAALRDKRGDEQGALEDYGDCLAADKKNSKAFHRRGQLRFKAGKTSGAIDDFYKAIALNISFGAAYFDRAKAYEAQGDRAFAGEDYRRACDLGVKAACAKAQELAPAKKSKSKSSKKKSAAAKKAADAPPPDEAAPAAEEAPAEPATGAEAPPAEESAPTPAPAPKKSRRAASSSSYSPKFADCLDAIQKCEDDGEATGACVERAPACEKKAVRGCCPETCLQAYRKDLNRGMSEGAAARDVFVPESTCAVPAKTDDDED